MIDPAALLATCAPARAAQTIAKIGTIVPSSNTVLEPLTTLLAALAGGGISQHVARVPVQRLGLDEASLAQFELERLLDAARLVAEAPLDVLVWNGTAGSWRGREHDERFVAAVGRETGLRATTATLAMYATYRRYGWTRIGLAVPYTDDITAAIATEYARHGLHVAGSANLGLTANVDMGNATAAEIRGLLVAAAAGAPDCIAVVCTNVAAIPLIAAFEAEYGIPVVDSIAVALIEAARLCGRDVRVPGFGAVLAGTTPGS